LERWEVERRGEERGENPTKGTVKKEKRDKESWE
jgi:hypothetical protein